MDDPKPPVMLCILIAGFTFTVCGLVFWVRSQSTSERELNSTAAMSSLQKDLSKVIQLKQIYSRPPEEEDPSKYPKIPSGNERHKRDPAKFTQ